MKMMKTLLRPVWHLYQRLSFAARREHIRIFLFDERRLWRNNHTASANGKERALAWITICYHIVEKGLTMPNRRLNFGKDNIKELMSRIRKYTKDYGCANDTVRHAIGTIKAYWNLHQVGTKVSWDAEFWNTISAFLGEYADIPAASQRVFTREEFYSKNGLSFYDFARSRHTVRHYSGKEIEIARIERAVSLAMTAPSACNRQHARVRCLCNHQLCQDVLREQGGNRGFGHLADKVLVVSADMCDTVSVAERYDAYLNGGIFLMNLCYALHYYEIAHCVLSCASCPDKDLHLRALTGIPENEVLVALICCGDAPSSFPVAESPRRELSEIFHIVK